MPFLDLTTRINRLVFPPVCVTCECQSDHAHRGFPGDPRMQFCHDCLNAMSPPARNVCRKCGAASDRNPFPSGCKLCHDLDLRFERAAAIGNYRGVLQEAVIKSKQRQNESLALQLGRLLGLQLKRIGLTEGVDLIMPVPTHWIRRLRRGFHGPSVIADGVAQMTGISKSDHVISCQRPTKKQGMLTGAGRRENVRNAFALRPRARVEGRTVLVIDDVMTSGATVSEMARTLLRGGASRVIVGVAARGAGVS